MLSYPSTAEFRISHRIRWILLGLVGLALVAGSPSNSVRASEGSASSSRVSAHGGATVVVEPDRVWVDLAIVSRDPKAAVAVAENARQSEAVESALRKSLGKSAEIVASGYSLAPNYRYVQGQGQKLDGYIARNRLRVTSKDVTTAGRVVDAASTAGASEIQQVSFGLRDDGPAGREALAAATRDGLARAKVIAGALDLRVLRVLSVEDGAAPAGPAIRSVQLMSKAESQSTVPTQLKPGGIRVHAEVTVFVEVGP